MLTSKPPAIGGRRQQLLRCIRVFTTVAGAGPNCFYTVTLPCTLWFLDRGKTRSDRKDKVLFIDARHIFGRLIRRTASSHRNRSSTLRMGVHDCAGHTDQLPRTYTTEIYDRKCDLVYQHFYENMRPIGISRPGNSFSRAAFFPLRTTKRSKFACFVPGLKPGPTKDSSTEPLWNQ
jgi:hypothetical protein